MPKPKVRFVKFSPGEMAYDLPSETEFKPNLMMGRSIHARLAKGEVLPRAKFVAVDDEAIAVTLVDGRKLVIPLDWYPRLRHGTPTERNTWRLLMGGIAIAWRELEQVINVESALAGERSKETPAALRKWLDAKQTRKREKTA